MTVCRHRLEDGGMFIGCRPCVCGQEYVAQQAQIEAQKTDQQPEGEEQ